MKKNLLIGLFLVLFLIPVLATAQAPIVQCGDDVNNNDKIDENEMCTITDFFGVGCLW